MGLRHLLLITLLLLLPSIVGCSMKYVSSDSRGAFQDGAKYTVIQGQVTLSIRGKQQPTEMAAPFGNLFIPEIVPLLSKTGLVAIYDNSTDASIYFDAIKSQINLNPIYMDKKKSYPSPASLLAKNNSDYLLMVNMEVAPKDPLTVGKVATSVAISLLTPFLAVPNTAPDSIFVTYVLLDRNGKIVTSNLFFTRQSKPYLRPEDKENRDEFYKLLVEEIKSSS